MLVLLLSHFGCVSPVFGKEKNGGNVIHHELPGKVVPCNIHPVFNTGTSMFKTGSSKKVFQVSFTQRNSGTSAPGHSDGAVSLQ